MSSETVDAVHLERRDIFYVLLMIGGMFVVLHLVMHLMSSSDDGLVVESYLLDLDHEASIPTWWQQLQFAAASCLCLLIGAIRRRPDSREHRYWRALGVILIYVSVDEASAIHEHLIDPMRSAFDITDGFLAFAWVIPGAAAVAVFGIVFFRFWLRLPGAPRLQMAVGGAIYLAGALGFEMVGGDRRTSLGADDGYAVLIAVEEGLEMVGIALLLLSLLTMLQLAQRSGGTPLEVRGSAPRTSLRLRPSVWTTGE